GVGVSRGDSVDGLSIVGIAGDVVVFYVVVDGHIADGPAAVGAGLYGTGLQGVQHQLSHVVTGHSLLHAGVHAHKQVDGVALAGGGQLPVAAEIGAVLEVAQSLHQHQGGLGGGHGVAATVDGVAVTSGDAVGPAGGHVGLGPRGDISEGAGVLV